MSAKIDFAIIGAQKSASSYIHMLFARNSHVWMSKGECAWFESPDYEQGAASINLERLAGRLNGAVKFGVKRPSYLCEPLIARRLHLHNPDMRLVAILRDPIARFVSAYFHNMGAGKLPVVDINAAIADMFEGRYLTSNPVGLQLLHYGNYWSGIRNYLECFKDDQLLLLEHDQVKVDPQAALDRVCDHVGVPRELAPPELVFKRPQRVIYSYGHARLQRIPNYFMYTYSTGKLRLEPRKGQVYRFLGRLFSWVNVVAFDSRQLDTRQILSPKSRLMLASYYRPEVAALHDIVPGSKTWLQ